MHKQNTRRGYTQQAACRACLSMTNLQATQKNVRFIPDLRGRTINYGLGASPTGAARLPENIRRKAGEMSGHALTYKKNALHKYFFRAPLRSGFTLIELLVVVLIIGILAAVAVPQYQKAVAKARAVELVSILRTGEKVMDAWILAHGYTDVSQSGMDIVIRPSETIKKFWLEQNFHCAGENPEYPDDDIGCWILFNDNGGGADISWANENYIWSRTCTPYTTNGQIICNYLKQSFPDMTISGSSDD